MRFSADLIEDYLHLVTPPVPEHVGSCFVAVQNALDEKSHAEVLTLNPEGGLSHWFYDEASASGWDHRDVDVPDAPSGKIVRLLAFYELGTLHVVVQYETAAGERRTRNACLHKYPHEERWRRIPTAPGSPLAVLESTRQIEVLRDAAGSHWLYGISTAEESARFFIATPQKVSPPWNVHTWESSGADDEALWLIPGDRGSEVALLRVRQRKATITDTQLIDGKLVPIGSGEIPLDLPPSSLAGVLAVPRTSRKRHWLHRRHKYAFLAASRDGQLYYHAITMSDSGRPRICTTELNDGADGPAKLLRIDAGLSNNSRMHVFAIDTQTQRLWLRREMESDTAGDLTFDPWVRLDDAVRAIACPLDMTSASELFLIGSDRQITHMRHDVDVDLWTQTVLQKPTPVDETPKKTGTYSIELTAVDELETPAPFAVFNVRADRSTTLRVNAVCYRVRPNETMPLFADGHGRLTIRIEAHEITAPGLEVNCPAFMKAREYRPFRLDQRAHNRLANTKATDLQASDRCLLPPDKVDAETVGQICGALNQLGGALEAKGQAGPDEKTTFSIRDVGRQRGFVFDLRSGSRPSVNPISAVDEHKYFEAFDADEILRGALGDAWHWVKKEAKHVGKIVTRVVAGAVHFAIEVAGEVRHLVAVSIEHLGAGLELILRKIGEAIGEGIAFIKKAIDFLKSLFEWEDIRHTAHAISALVERGLGSLEALTGKEGREYLRGRLAEVQQELEAALGHARERQAGCNLHDRASKAGSSPAQRALASDSVRCNYVSHNATHGSAPSELHAALQPVRLRLAAQLGQLPISVPSVIGGSGTALAVRFPDPVELLHGDILEFLQEALVAIVDTVFEGIEDSLDLILQAADHGLQMLREILDTRLRIPVITWLYEEVIDPGQELNLRNLLGLLVAVPMTIVYKVIHPGARPFAGQIPSTTPAPMPWDTAAAPGDLRAECAAEATSNGPGDESVLLMYKGLVDLGSDMLEYSVPVGEVGEFDEWKVIPRLYDVVLLAVFLPTGVKDKDHRVADDLWLAWVAALLDFFTNFAPKKAEWIKDTAPILLGATQVTGLLLAAERMHGLRETALTSGDTEPFSENDLQAAYVEAAQIGIHTVLSSTKLRNPSIAGTMGVADFVIDMYLAVLVA